MGNENIFADEWRDCLKAHYMNTVRQRDEVTLRTLVQVMHEVGFSEDELRAMYVGATMHVDDVGPDFVPDLARAVEPEAPAPVELPPLAPEPPPYVSPVDEHSDEVDEEEEANRYIPPPPQQMSLF